MPDQIRNDLLIEAYRKGASAAFDGGSKQDSPYQPHSDLHAAWLLGFEIERDEALWREHEKEVMR